MMPSRSFAARLRNLVLVLYAAAGMLPGTALPGRDLPGDFFADNTFDQFETEQWFGKYLYEMDEPSLYRRARKDVSATAYRITCFPPYSPFVALFLQIKTDGSGLLELKKMEQVCINESYEPGRSIRKANFDISKREVKQFQELLENMGFWHLAPRRNLEALGGEMFLYEGISHGVWHAVEIPVPPYSDLTPPAVYLMKLAGERLDE